MLRCPLGISLRTLFLKQVPVFASLLPKLERVYSTEVLGRQQGYSFPL